MEDTMIKISDIQIIKDKLTSYIEKYAEKVPILRDLLLLFVKDHNNYMHIIECEKKVNYHNSAVVATILQAYIWNTYYLFKDNFIQLNSLDDEIFRLWGNDYSLNDLISNNIISRYPNLKESIFIPHEFALIDILEKVGKSNINTLLNEYIHVTK